MINRVWVGVGGFLHVACWVCKDTGKDASLATRRRQSMQPVTPFHNHRAFTAVLRAQPPIYIYIYLPACPRRFSMGLTA